MKMKKIKYEVTKVHCPFCISSNLNYCAEFDSYYCDCKDEWLLSVSCNDMNCLYCPKRPEKPSMVKWKKDA